jgi:hypothetical protein
VDLCFATESKVLRQNEDGTQFYEVLAMHPKHADLSRLNRGAALLDNHNRTSIDSQIGVIEKAWIDTESRQAFVTARLSESPERSRIWEDVKSGIIQNVSFGYTVERFVPLHEYQQLLREEENEDKNQGEQDEADKAEEKSKSKSRNKKKSADQEDEDESSEDEADESTGTKRSIPTLVALGWQALEVSLVTIPADIEAGTRNVTHKLNIRTLNQRNLMNTEITEKSNEKTTDQPIDDTTLQQATKAATKAAIDRLLEIQSITRIAGLPPTVEERYLKSALSLDEIRQDAFKQMSELATKVETRAHLNIHASAQDETANRREGMENAILHRANPFKFKLDQRGIRFSKMSLIHLARQTIKDTGMRTVDHFSDDEVVTRALQGTSEFPILLTNVMNKSLRADYEGAPSIWRAFTRIVPVKDFRPVYKMQLGDIPVPTRVNEKGEARRVTLSESQTSYRIHSYSQIINFTREIMINDDLNFIASIPGKIGLACAELEANIVLGLITGNTVMSDGVPLFDPRHNNILSGGHIIDIESTSKVRAQMRHHVGLDGRKLNITPVNYVVPTAIETLAEQFVSTHLMANATNNINPFAGKLGVLCDVRFDDVSPYDWYMIASPASVDIIEAAYLNGAEGPRFESRQGFEVSGMELKCSMDFGAGLIDYRGIFKVEGKNPESLGPSSDASSRSRSRASSVKSDKEGE